jgi:hypothetical protein
VRRRKGEQERSPVQGVFLLPRQEDIQGQAQERGKRRGRPKRVRLRIGGARIVALVIIRATPIAVLVPIIGTPAVPIPIVGVASVGVTIVRAAITIAIIVIAAPVLSHVTVKGPMFPFEFTVELAVLPAGMGHLVEILVHVTKLPVDCSMLSAAMSKGHRGGHE